MGSNDRSNGAEAGMKRTVILLCDLVVISGVLGWTLLGPWDRILGFSTYLSRGNVWLPTPPAAAAYFREMVSTGSIIFAILFMLASSLGYFDPRARASSNPASPGGILYQMFYEDSYRLFVKYSDLLLVSFVAPLFYNYMWRFHVARPLRIAGGLAITIIVFVAILLTGSLLARVAHSRSASHPESLTGIKA
jgi:hypothetical protein